MTLEHITILDLTHMLSGPYGTMLLTDLGARTIKIEPPGGEFTRSLMRDDPLNSRDGMGAYFLTLNRNKRSVCIDLKTGRGLEVFLDLVRHADVVFDNFSVGVTRRLGIDHAALAAVNPAIVSCSVTGFGQTGPHTQLPAFDQVVQAMGGGMAITGSKETGPIRSGIPMGDLGGGAFGAIGVLAALVERERTGVGQHVDVSMLDVQVSLLNYMATMYFLSGEVPSGIGNSHFVHVPYNCYPTSDGHIVIACIGDAFFARFVECVDIPALRDERFLQQPARQAAKTMIDGLIAAELRRRPTQHWLALLREARIPCGPVNDMRQVMIDPQVVARDMVIEVPLHSGERVKMPGNPIKLSAGRDMSHRAPPRLGEDTDQVLREMARYDADRMSELRAAGTIA